MKNRVVCGIFLGSLILLNNACASRSVPKVAPESLHAYIYSMGIQPTEHLILVDSDKQEMIHLYKNRIQKIYTVSTSKKGLGETINTYKTPQGLHRIHEKIGHGAPNYAIFHRRQYIDVWKPLPRHQHRKDYVSTRILRLQGLQPGLNQGKNLFGQVVDSERRAIYIHGTTMEWKLGSPSTKGCVHMSASDVVKLFNSVPLGTLVWIH